MRLSPARNLLSVAIAFGAALALAPMQASANAHIIVVNTNAPGVGFNDPTPAVPVGGNPGVTLGQQRLNAFQKAADIWGATLDSAALIEINATFEPLSCNATSAVLGSAGPTTVFANFPGAPVTNTWYHSALAGKLFGEDPVPEGATPGSGADIRARFNSSLGSAGCLTGTGWYLGFDENHGANIDLVTVLLHEFGHGLGFSAITSSGNGAQLQGIPGAYERFLHDDGTGKQWPAMTNAERAASAIGGRLSWTGATVTSTVPSVLSLGTPLLRVNAPSAIAGVYKVGTASFGPTLNSPGVTGNLVVATDASDGFGLSTTDGCSAITNAAAVAGKVAIVDRGTCGFTAKAKNLQDAGAVGVVIADNAAGSPPAGLGGTDPTITIPAVRVTQPDGVLLKAHQGDSATLGVDMTVYAGADDAGRALLYSPNPLVSGSSVSHWDVSAFRNQLMEPNINGDLTHSVKAPEDLTLALMRDIGWYPDADVDGVQDSDDQCANSVLGGNVTIGSCNSGVENTFFTNGCSIVDVVNQCGAAAATHTDFTTCVSNFTNALKPGLISGKQKGAIQKCAATANVP